MRSGSWIARTTTLLPLVLLLALPAGGKAEDYLYATASGTATITGYTGSVGVVTIPATLGGLPVVGIEHDAFSGSTNLTSVTILDGVTNLGEWAFAFCNSLTNARLGNGITNLGADAFYKCPSLRSVTIGRGVAALGASAFGACSNLVGVYFKGNAPGTGASIYDGDPLATNYYVVGTTGWGASFAGRPTAVWVPAVPHFGRTQTLQVSSPGWCDVGVYDFIQGTSSANTNASGTFSFGYSLAFDAGGRSNFYGIVVNDHTAGGVVQVVWLLDEDLP